MPVSRSLARALRNNLGLNSTTYDELIAHLENRDPTIPPKNQGAGTGTSAGSQPTPIIKKSAPAAPKKEKALK